MAKTFDQPQQGPKLGPVKNFKDLPPEKREQLGEMDKIVSEPAKLDPRLAAEVPIEAPQMPSETINEGEETQKTPETIAAEIQALRAIIENEAPEPEPDYEEEALQAAAMPTEDDKRRFMRCIFGDTQYTKEYSLFGGMLIVELVDQPPATEDKLFIQLSLDQKENLIETQDDWDLQLERYRMIANISKIIWSGNQIMGPNEETDLRKAVETRINDGIKNSVVYRALLRVTRVFRRHLDVLLERAMDSDFWTVDGPNSQQEVI